MWWTDYENGIPFFELEQYYASTAAMLGPAYSLYTLLNYVTLEFSYVQ